MFSKAQEEERRKEFLAPDYSNVKDEEEDPDEIGITDDDDDLDDIDDIEDDDPEEEEKVLEIRETLPEVEDDLPFSTSTPKPQQPSPQPFYNPQNNQQRTVAPPTWPSGGSSFWNQGGNNQQNNPWGQSGGNSGWKPSSGWGNTQGSSPWGTQTTPSQGQEILNRQKKVIICDVLDCLICTLEGPQKTGLIPRDIWDISPRFDVWSALKRFGYIERIYATIPRSLITNSSGDENWIKLLNYISAALASFLRVPTEAVQILTQSFISQSKVDVIGSVINGLPKDEIVYIGTQSGYQFQSSSDIDCATALEIDYIDLGKFLTIYS